VYGKAQKNLKKTKEQLQKTSGTNQDTMASVEISFFKLLKGVVMLYQKQ
jgi:hypothetical protein